MFWEVSGCVTPGPADSAQCCRDGTAVHDGAPFSPSRKRVDPGFASNMLFRAIHHRIVAQGLIAIVGHLRFWYTPGGRLAAEELAESFWSTFIEGARPVDPERC